MADLKYNIESRILKGTLGKIGIHATALSGGRAGSTMVSANPNLANNSFATHIGGIKSEGTHNYGPIPRGIYKMVIHEKKDTWIRLVPASSNNMHGRDGFAIHGRGETGSHGCIVLGDRNIIKTICEAVKNTHNRTYTLEVVSVGTFEQLYTA